MYTLAAFLTIVNDLARIDDDDISTASRYRAIKTALGTYDHDAPYVITGEFTGDGGRFYDLSQLSGFEDGFSDVLNVEYPVGDVSDDTPPTYLDSSSYDASYRIGTTRYLYLKNATPSSTETLRVWFTSHRSWVASSTTQDINQVAHGFSVDDEINEATGGWEKSAASELSTHIVTAVADEDNFTAAIQAVDLPSSSFYAVCYLAACDLCRQEAARFSQIGDSLLGADASSHTTKAQEYADRARDLCKVYAQLAGVSASDDGTRNNESGGRFVDLDTAPGYRRGRPYLFHRGR